MGDIMKTVLVTGSSRGIGKEIVIEFAKLGYNVIINYLNSELEALKLKEFIKNEYNVDAIAIKCDVSNEEEVIYMVKELIEHFKFIDVLVNNAGMAIDNDISLKSASEFKKVLDINLVGSYLVTKYVSKHMIEKKKGNIIFISSTNGIDTNYEYSIDYDASKAGVISLMKNFSNMLAPYIRVNTIAPGWVNTDMNKDISEDMKNFETKNILLNRFADPKEIAKVIMFLASDDFGYINNTVIRVDGGIR